MTKLSPLRVLLADDHTFYRRGVVAELARHPQVEVVGEAGDGLEAIALARETRPELILMDLSMPHMNGLQALQAIKEEMPEVRIVVLSVHDDDEHLFEAIRRGADGYLLKTIEPRALLDVLERLQHGEAAIDGELAARILHEFRRLHTRAARPHAQPLTSREVTVLEHLVKGETNREIAEALVVTEHTVKMHVRNILDKLHLQNRSQAAIHALREGLVEDASQPPSTPPQE